MFTPFGTESVMAPTTPLMSRSYAFQWAPPFFHTGVMADTKVDKNFSVKNMIVNGNDVFFDGSQEWRYVGAATLTQSFEVAKDPRVDVADAELVEQYTWAKKAHDMLNRVQYRRDSIVITKDGKPVAALIDAQLFERIRQMQDRFDELSAEIAKAFADVPEEEGIAEINRVAAEVRAEMKAERQKKKKA